MKVYTHHQFDDTVGIDKLLAYNAADCCVTLKVYQELQKQLASNSNANRIYRQNLQLRNAVLEMELHGIKVNTTLREQEKEKAIKRRDKIEAFLIKLADQAFQFNLDLNSAPNRGAFLYDVMDMPEQKVFRKTTGKMTRSSAKDELLKIDTTNNKMAGFVVQLVVEYMGLASAIRTMSVRLCSKGRYRSNFNIVGAVTGRMSSKQSAYEWMLNDKGKGIKIGGNLQNLKKSMRRFLTPDEGMIGVSIDFSQADSRNFGATAFMLLGEHTYLDVCESEDLHSSVARMVWPGLENVKEKFYQDKTYRDIAKTAGHGTNYLMKAKEMMGVPTSLIAEFQAKYFLAFPEIEALHEKIAFMLLADPTLTTIYGRPRTFLGPADNAKTLRDAVAYMGQSPTADEINTALTALPKTSLPIQLLNQVHDDIWFQVPEKLANEVIPQVVEIMQKPIVLKSPSGEEREFFVPVEVETGHNFAPANDENPWGLKEWSGAA